MKSLPILAALALLLTAAASPCLAEMAVERVSAERAKALGIELTAKASGPAAAWLELSFPADGPLKDFDRVTLEVRDGDKLLVGYAALREKRPASGRVVVGFMAGRDALDKITLTVVTGQPMDYTGRELRVRDFVDPAAIR